MLAIEGWTLDDAVRLLRPQPGWPSRPRLSGPMGGWSLHTHTLRHYLAGLHPTPIVTRSSTQISVEPFIGRRFDRADGGYLRLDAVDHSLELATQIGPASVSTRFGELHLELDFELPHTIFTACVGRKIEEIVDHVAWRGRGWRIVATQEAGKLRDQMLVVVTGSVEYRMPWAR